MKEIEHLQVQWRDRARFRGLTANILLEKDGLVLGAGTLLAKRDDDGAFELEGKEGRLLALLSVAYGRPVDANILAVLLRASTHARAGNDALAAMHIALGGLPRLSDPEGAARRLFVADGLIKIGVRPRDIFVALDFDPSPLDALEKDGHFNPNELRNPKGDGRISGEWARDIEELPSDIEEGAGELLPRIASRILSVVAVLEPVVFPPHTGGEEHEGTVQGRPELLYRWIEDDDAILISRQADGQTILRVNLDMADGTLRVGQRIVGRKKGDEVVIDPFILPDKGTDTDQDDRRDMCPKDEPDNPGRGEDKGKKDKDFEDYMKARVNPLDPTPRGMGYPFPKPWAPADFIIFDDCQHETGDLYDAKGTGYAALLTKQK